MSNEIIGKTIYVLGAGASHHTGTPLLKDFLTTSRLKMESKKELVFKESFEAIFTWIDKLRASTYYVDFDLDNLEHIFSLADMKRQIGLDGGDFYCSHLKKVITETLDDKPLVHTMKNIEPDPLYSKFVELLFELNEKRQKRYVKAGGDQGLMDFDAVISFNYDVMLDFAFYYSNREVYKYCLTEKIQPNKIPLLKLHGSTNWATCRNCNDGQIQVCNPHPMPPGFFLDTYSEHGTYDFSMTTNVLKKSRCNKCNEVGTLEPFIIPPTWSKAIGNLPIAKVWKEAVAQIESAFQIVVIGYSMPPTDTFFQYLLTLGLDKNPNLHRIIVVNPDIQTEFQQRYEKVFSRSLKERGRLNFIKSNFVDFVSTDMIKISGKI